MKDPTDTQVILSEAKDPTDTQVILSEAKDPTNAVLQQQWDSSGFALRMTDKGKKGQKAPINRGAVTEGD